MRRGTRRAWPMMVGIFVVIAGLPFASPAPVAASSADLYFSEYVEGSLFNKALEIYNNTGTAVNLAAGGYNVQMFFNGSTTPLLTITLTGSVAHGDVYVLANGFASPSILAIADQTESSSWYNGDDAVVLRKGTTLIDVIGQIGFDPGTEWGSGLASTLDNTLRRKPIVTSGDPDGTNAFDPSLEWDGFAVDVWEGLGSYESGPSVVSTSPADGAVDVPASANVEITFSEPVDVVSDWFTISCTDTGAHTAAVSGGPTTFTFDPAVDFGAADVCTVTVVASKVTDQDADDPPDNMAADQPFSFTTESTVDVCELQYTPIYQIQGSGLSAAITGSVTTQGVVVGDFEGPTSAGLQGFYLQDGSGDGNTATSDGIFVFTGNADNAVSVGDVVRVTGYARERFAQTALNGTNSNTSPVTDIVACGTADVPEAVEVTLPVSAPTDFEKYEGMHVVFPQALVIAEYFNYDRFGEMVLARPLAGEDRPFTPTSLEEPGSAGFMARASANFLSRVTLDDGLGSQNPSSNRHPNGDPFSLTNTFRGGDRVENAVGVLGYDFNVYRIQPTGPADYTSVNPRPTAPDSVGGSIQVAALNTLNFFLTLDTTSNDSGPGPCGGNQDLDCRGADADQPNEFQRQRDKLVATLAGLGAEVIGLNELENTPGVDPLGDPDDGLVAGLNDLLGDGTYDSIDTGVIGTDAIRVGLIYKPGAVTPLGTFEILDSTDDPRFADNRSRPALAQTFSVNATGAVFTVVVNHLKSKSESGLAPAPPAAPGICNDANPGNDTPDCDQGDGQGFWNHTRKLAAQALVDWLATDPTGSGDPDFLIIGDLNSYAQEDPIDAAKAGSDDTHGTGDDYINLVAKYEGAYAYSYVFDGQAGYLDHALSTSSLTAQVAGATEWHVNADEPDLLDYDTSFKSAAQDALYEPLAYRASDHDPVIVGLNLVGSVGKLTGSGTWADGSLDISAQFEIGALVPTGSTTLIVPGGTLVSTGYDWLLVQGNRATLQGTGTLDGEAGFGFRLSARDGGSPGTSDRIRVEVWDADGDILYDSQPGDPFGADPSTPLTSGNLTVHKLK